MTPHRVDIVLETTRPDLNYVHLRFYVTSKGEMRILEIRWGNPKRYYEQQSIMPRFVHGAYVSDGDDADPAVLDFCNGAQVQAMMQTEVKRLIALLTKALH